MNRQPLYSEEHTSLCDVLDRVLNKGVVVQGDIVISVADVDLIYLGVRLLLTSVETARQAGMNLDGRWAAPTTNPPNQGYGSC